MSTDDHYIEMVIHRADGSTFTVGMMESVLRYQPQLARERLNRGIKIEAKALAIREQERLASASQTTSVIDSKTGAVLWAKA